MIDRKYCVQFASKWGTEFLETKNKSSCAVCSLFILKKKKKKNLTIIMVKETTLSQLLIQIEIVDSSY